MKTMLIKNGHLFDPANGLDSRGDLLIENGKITAVGQVEAPAQAEIIDVEGQVVLPGLVDLCVSLREPGYKQKGSIQSELSAAAKGGVTDLCSHPLSRPVNDVEAITRLILDKTTEAQKSRVFPVAVATKSAEGAQLSEYQGLKNAGCVAVCHNRATKVSTPVLRRSFQYARTHDMMVMIEAEDPELAVDGCINEGLVSSRLGLIGIPDVAETIPLSRALLLAEETGAKVHFCQISTAKSVDMIARAKARGLPVTCDVALSHLLLTEMDIEDFNSQYHLRPPLRTAEDQAALIAGVENGVIDAIVSQHLPHESAAKQAPFAEAEAGSSVVEFLLPLAWGLQDKQISKARLVQAITAGPANVIGIANGLKQGNEANLCIFNPGVTQTLSSQAMVSKGANTPFDGHPLAGAVSYTLVGGRVVFERE